MKITFSGTIEIVQDKQPIIEHYDKWLRTTRILQGLTMTELAKLSGVSASHIGRIERGERVPGSRILDKLRKALDK